MFLKQVTNNILVVHIRTAIQCLWCNLLCCLAIFLKFAWRYKATERPKWTGWGLKPFWINYSCMTLDSDSYWAEVVGSTPTRSISFCEGITVLNQACFRLLSDRMSSNVLDRSDRKKFDKVFDIPRLHISACSYRTQPVRLYPIIMLILLCC
jgi:hypothetical protein